MVAVRIIALTNKAEEVMRKVKEDSDKIENDMKSLSSLNPKRIKFNMEQSAAKRIVTEEFFDNPVMIVATVKPKYDNSAVIFVDKIKNDLRKIMLNSGCNAEDYTIEVL